MAIAMVLLVLLLGSALLHATRQQLAAALSLVADERRYLIDYHQALSALAWGERLDWPPGSGWRCRQQTRFGWQACLLPLDNDEALLRGAALAETQEALALWQRLRRSGNGRWLPAAHGWLDFCPLSVAGDCTPDAR
ncbi:DUF2509 family protein [Mixta tenebrionis]|uniref:DUF2509 family protein n=1 Tax=Mixta tenebrionis TaxID=2562439 RepID=A0A506V7J6_9GAMM|nr:MULTISPECIES: DUF2509 family protein [Mixta]QHM74353.1 hypothetical protein C7M52_00277 [Mixta theicola]TPW41637.1 DUF2509 family protein [Mixta tenebrionis]